MIVFAVTFLTNSSELPVRGYLVLFGTARPVFPSRLVARFQKENKAVLAEEYKDYKGPVI